MSLALAINGRFDWKALPVYAIAQTIGAFLAAAVVYGLYSVGINSLAPDAAVHIFATAPNGIYTDDGSHGILLWVFYYFVSTTLILFTLFSADQVIGTMILVLTVLSVTDSRNNVSPGIAPIMIGLAIGGVGMSFGFNCGFAINPARDFGPRLFTSLIYGTSVFHEHNYFFWVPIVGPLVGGAIGGGAYKLLTEILVLQQSPKISEI